MKVILILDSVPIHTADKVKKRELKDIPHAFLTPYTPEFNPRSFTGVLIITR